jgi:hypothetical protein
LINGIRLSLITVYWLMEWWFILRLSLITVFGCFIRCRGCMDLRRLIFLFLSQKHCILGKQGRRLRTR